MKLKRMASVILSCAFAGAIFAGCGSEEPKKPAAENSGEIRVGMIANLNASEQRINEIFKRIEERSGVKLSNHHAVYYDNFTSMEMGLESNSIQEMSTYQVVAKYLEGMNENKFQEADEHGLKLQDSFCFAMLKDKVELKAELDKTLEELKADGTLEGVTKTYITDLKPGEEPPAVVIDHFDGAETIKVAVTGDLPPLDLVLENGTPAGFNTALMAEIALRLQKNIELIDIDSAARGAALTSGEVDVVFWAIRPLDDDRPKDIDMPENVDFSTPYFTDDIVHLALKK